MDTSRLFAAFAGRKGKHSTTKKSTRRHQLKQFKELLAGNKPMTAMMASVELGIERANLTRYKRDLERRGILKEVHIAKCEITQELAAYLSTNPEIIEDATRGQKLVDSALKELKPVIKGAIRKEPMTEEDFVLSKMKGDRHDLTIGETCAFGYDSVIQMIREYNRIAHA